MAKQPTESQMRKDLENMRDVIDKLSPEQKKVLLKGLSHIKRVVGDARHVQSFSHALSCSPCQDPIKPGW